MPSGPEGTQRAVAASQQQAQRRNSILNLWLRPGEVAVIRSLASGKAGDTHWEIRQVHNPANYRLPWMPCPTSDNDEGICQCSPEMIPVGYAPKVMAGTFVWLYGTWRVIQPKPYRNKVAQLVTLSEQLQSVMFSRGISDPLEGARWFEETNEPRMWFRGLDFNEAFPNQYYKTLTERSEGGNLTAHDIVVIPVPTPPNAADITSPDWRYELIAPSNRVVADWPEAQIPWRSEAIAAEQRRYFEALPAAAEYFMGTMKWPLFDREGQSARVPLRPTAPPPNAPPAGTLPTIGGAPAVLPSMPSSMFPAQAPAGAPPIVAGEYLPRMVAVTDEVKHPDLERVREPEPASLPPRPAPMPVNPTPPEGAPESRGLREFLD